MSWIIKNNRLAYENEDGIVFPSAEEITVLNRGGSLDKFRNAERPSEAGLNVRFSRLGARLKIVLSFDDECNEICLQLYATKGGKRIYITFDNCKLPDSVVIDGSWYNLLANYEDTVTLLRNSGIAANGIISLSQYVALKKLSSAGRKAEIDDCAEAFLSNHPVKDRSGSMPATLHANLYPYQQQGYQWMRFIAEQECGCILGDEMGLGKTLQVIALITDRKQAGHVPALIVAPVSLLENWRREFEKFTTGLKVFVHHGVHRTGLYTDLMEYDAVIISYNTACSDQSLLRMIDWDLLIVDEAQNIKNPHAARTRSIKNIPRHVAVAVTGTPFENHITDLWSLMDFVAPGCFGRLSDFEKEFPDDIDGARQLEPVLSPIMIRRRVNDVARDLPDRVDVPQVLQMTPREISDYEQAREEILADFDGKNATLPMLQKLRMYCTHPQLLDNQEKSDPIIRSGKYERLCELLEEIILIGEKVILFTSYNKMFDILMNDIPARFGIRVLAINGSTPTRDRQAIIDEFSDIVGCALLVLNPRAAGTGLNITAASRVIHYNLEWNPSLEDQASARAYRRGQTKTVFVYRLYYKDTVEEIINDRINKKRDMFGAAVIGTDGSLENKEDIIRALMISPGGTGNGE